jgi:protoporphyrinogen oxidase
MNQILIIGSGITGLSAGRMLQQKNKNVTIYERKAHHGGLIHCENRDQHLYHLVGGHVFNSRNQEILDWFWQFFDRDNEFIKTKRQAKVWWDDKLIGYPIEDYVYLMDEQKIKSILTDWLKLEKSGVPVNPFEYKNFGAFLRSRFGDTLYDLYFKPYNQKIWQTDLDMVPMPWLEGKLPMPRIADMLFNNMVKREESGMVHSTFFYPKKGGSQFIADRLAEKIKIRYNTEIKTLQFNGKWIVNGTETFDAIIYTGDIRKLSSLLIGGPELPGELTAQLSNGTSNMLCETDITDTSWLYIPNPNVKAHRIIYTGNFSQTNNAPEHRPSCVVEFSGHTQPEVMKQEIKNLPGNLTPLSWNYEPDSYVIQKPNTREIIQHAKNQLEPLNFFLAGRFAEWEYYNMDKCIESVMELVKKLD